jgi:hypothetical protein
MLKRQKVICPVAEDCDCSRKSEEHMYPCNHGIEHIQNNKCFAVAGCPECIKTQEVIEEETFKEEEFEL